MAKFILELPKEVQKDIFNKAVTYLWVVDLDRWDIAYRIGLIRC